MELQTHCDMAECIRIFQETVKKRPLRLKPFPFRCHAPEFSGDWATISASFQFAEPYGVVKMRCEKRVGGTLVTFLTDGNIRGKITAYSMAKHIVSQLR